MTPQEFKAARLALSLSQTALAKEWGVSRWTIIRLENGGTPILQRDIDAMSWLRMLTKLGQ